MISFEFPENLDMTTLGGGVAQVCFIMSDAMRRAAEEAGIEPNEMIAPIAMMLGILISFCAQNAADPEAASKAMVHVHGLMEKSIDMARKSNLHS